MRVKIAHEPDTSASTDPATADRWARSLTNQEVMNEIGFLFTCGFFEGKLVKMGALHREYRRRGLQL